MELYDACKIGNLDEVKYLVSKGANIHANNDLALRLAAELGHLDIVKYLVSKGANIHTENDLALRLAVRNGHLEVVKYLVSKGADIHANNDQAFSLAAEFGHLEVVKYLKEQLNNKEVKTNIKDEEGIYTFRNGLDNYCSGDFYFYANSLDHAVELATQFATNHNKGILNNGNYSIKWDEESIAFSKLEVGFLPLNRHMVPVGKSIV